MREKRLKHLMLIAVPLIIFILILYYRVPSSDANTFQQHINVNPRFPPSEGHKDAADIAFPVFTQLWYEENCLAMAKTKGKSISSLYKKMNLFKTSALEECRAISEIFSDMFRFEEIIAPLVVPKPFQKQVLKWLDNNEQLFEQVSHQKIYKVVNKWTSEETVFNPLRSKRPTSKSVTNPLDYIENLTLSTRDSCDFCSYKDHTAEDVFGRIENNYSASASNTFKLAKFHGLFFPKLHHPLNISLEVLSELFVKTSQQWFKKAHETDAKQIYPSLLWDTLPHAGASQVHPHVHGLLSDNQYAGLIEITHQVALNYYNLYQRSYWTDFILIHWALGLTIQENQTMLIVPLNAKKDHEYMIVSRSSVSEDFVKLLYRVIKGYKNNLNVFCWSGAGAYPVLQNTTSPGLPLIFRISSRGVCTSISSDVSSLELYTVNNINTDIEKTFQSIQNYS